jgi:hypothetical protein
MNMIRAWMKVVKMSQPRRRTPGRGSAGCKRLGAIRESNELTVIGGFWECECSPMKCPRCPKTNAEPRNEPRETPVSRSRGCAPTMDTVRRMAFPVSEGVSGRTNAWRTGPAHCRDDSRFDAKVEKSAYVVASRILRRRQLSFSFLRCNADNMSCETSLTPLRTPGAPTSGRYLPSGHSPLGNPPTPRASSMVEKRISGM